MLFKKSFYKAIKGGYKKMKTYDYKTFTFKTLEGDKLDIICFVFDTGRSWGHRAVIQNTGEQVKINYYNRTWEAFKYESVLYKAISAYYPQEKRQKAQRAFIHKQLKAIAHNEAMREHWAYSVNRLKIVKYNTKTPIKNCYVRIEGHGVFARFSKYGYRYSYCICDDFKMTEQRAKQVVEKIHRLFGNDRKCEIVKEGA